MDLLKLDALRLETKRRDCCPCWFAGRKRGDTEETDNTFESLPEQTEQAERSLDDRFLQMKETIFS